LSSTLPPEAPPQAVESEPLKVQERQHPNAHAQSISSSLASYALVGAVAALLLGAIECVDLQIQLTPVFASFWERAALVVYSSLDVVTGSLIGLAVGLAVRLGGFIKHKIERVLTKRAEPHLWQKLVSLIATCAIAAVVLDQQPHIFGYTLSVIREAEKLSSRLVRVERMGTYFAVVSVLVACWIAFSLARRSAAWRRGQRYAFYLALVLLIGAAYYVDSRVEVQQYDYSLHRSMFLLDTGLAITLIGAIGLASAGLRAGYAKLGSRLKITLTLAVGMVGVSCLAFTLAKFDKNQNLKTQVFYRSTQAKQHFKLAQWVLDFDRDGYSSLLGGGDPDDTQSGLNPGVAELVADHVDNNHIGGDLTPEAIEEWRSTLASLSSPANPGARRFNVIYIFVDTLRADHLGTYGYGRETSPNLDKLAAKSAVFENAFTPAPVTFQAVPRFMQSSYWDANLPTWTEILAHNDYYTVLFPGRRSTLSRRIKDPNVVSAHRTGNVDGTVRTAIEMLSKAPKDRPFCAFLYSVEPHRPYRARPDYWFGSSLSDLYDGEIAFSDYYYGKLFDWLETSGRINDTIVVFMSDHGESLGERGVYKHNSQLYDEQLHVPVIFHVPGQTPRRVSDYVSTVDLGSTILNAVGLTCPPDYLGVSLMPLIRGEAFTHPPVYAEHVHRSTSPFFGPAEIVDPETRKYAMITQDGYKLIYNRDVYSFELFDLRSDPKEEHNLYDVMPDRAIRMRRLLGRFVDLSTLRQDWRDEIWLAPDKK
jgi:arylsulfatase A-like enzyme